MTDKEIKKTIRQGTLQKRDSISKSAKEEKDAAIIQRIVKLPEFINAKTVFFYASFRSEVDTMNMIKLSISMGKLIVLPKVDKENNRLKLYEIKGLSELSHGCMHILEPSVSEDRLRGLNDVDLIVIPGAAFDSRGNRLGYGAGFYDMLLSKMEKKIPIVAPAYEEQIVERIPEEPHDIKVDKIVTEKRIIEC